MKLKRLMFPTVQFLVSLTLFGHQLVMLFHGMPDWSGLLSSGWYAFLSFCELVKAIIRLLKDDEDGTSPPAKNDAPPND